MKLIITGQTDLVHPIVWPRESLTKLIIIGQSDSVHRGVRIGECLMKLKSSILWDLHIAQVIPMNHGGIQHLPKQSCKYLSKTHYFVYFHTNCNILGFHGAQSHWSLFPATPRNHGSPQTEEKPKGFLAIHCAPYPIIINISLQSHINTGSISQAISNYASQPNTWFVATQCICLEWLMNWISALTAQQISCLVLNKYINDPISCWDMIGSIKSE